MTALRPPSADSVLYVVYQRDGDGAVTYEIDGGSVVSFWHGQAFEHAGKYYYVGFTTRTDGREGGIADDGMMAPGQVAIGQATFVQAGTPEQPRWAQVETDGYVGEFGAHDQGDPVDGRRPVQMHDTGDGRVLLAIPTRRFAGGVVRCQHAMFLFDPGNTDGLGFRRWGYLGSVAGLAGDEAVPGGLGADAAGSQATPLAFGAAGAHGLPLLAYASAGAVAGEDEGRGPGPANALTYAFDTKAGIYQP